MSSLLAQFYPRHKMKIPLEIDIIDQSSWVWYFLLFSIFSLWSWSINILVIDILMSRSKSTILSWKLVMLVTRCPPVKYFFHVKLDNWKVEIFFPLPFNLALYTLSALMAENKCPALMTVFKTFFQNQFLNLVSSPGAPVFKTFLLKKAKLVFRFGQQPHLW